MKKNEVRYIITDAVSIPVYKLASKTEAYKQATAPGMGTVEWYSAANGYTFPVNRDRSDKTQQLSCDEDSHADLYTKNGGYFGIYPYDEINVKEMPKQAEVETIIHADSCGYDFYGPVKIFVTYDENGLIDTYRIEGKDEQPCEGETEIQFEDLYEQAEDDWNGSYRADIPGTIEYDRKHEADSTTADAGEADAEAEQKASGEQVEANEEAEQKASLPSMEAGAAPGTGDTKIATRCRGSPQMPWRSVRRTAERRQENETRGQIPGHQDVPLLQRQPETPGDGRLRGSGSL